MKLPQLCMSKLAVIFWLVITWMDPEGETFKVRSGKWSGGIGSPKHQFLKCPYVGSWPQRTMYVLIIWHCYGYYGCPA